MEFVIDRAVTKLAEIEKKRQFGVGHFPGAKIEDLGVENDDAVSASSEGSASSKVVDLVHTALAITNGLECELKPLRAAEVHHGEQTEASDTDLGEFGAVHVRAIRVCGE